MKTHRYTQIIVPIDRFISRLSPKAKMLVGVLEGGLFLVLLSSVIFHM